MKEFYLATQNIISDGRVPNSVWVNVGVFGDKQMALAWMNEDLDNRSIRTLPMLDKTFAQMSVEYNRKYEG